MKEYGGFLPIELQEKQEYYNLSRGSILRTNSGRTAIICAIKNEKFDMVWVPIYTCHSVIDALLMNKIKFSYYHINADFMPEAVEVKDNDLIIWTNYYGIQSERVIELLRQKYKHILFDNTQAFFASPDMEQYNVYSCRKFFGVSDGAYLLHKGIRDFDLKKSESAQAAQYLLGSLESGTNLQYRNYLLDEKKIEQETGSRMSKLTLQILKTIDYESVEKKRIQNFEYLNSKLENMNEFKIEINEKIVPMVYPLLICDTHIRDYLIRNRIYVSQWWKWITDEALGNEFETLLSEYLLPIPIDQRYGINDMKAIVKIIKKYGI